MAAKLDTMGVDFETNNRRTTNAPSIWDRLPYNIGMELHHCASTTASAAKNDSNDDDDDYNAHNSSFNCYQQQLAHDTRQLSLLPPPPPTPLSSSSSLTTTPPPPHQIVVNDDDEKDSPFTLFNSTSRGRGGNSQGPTRIPLPLNYTHHQYQQQQQQQQQHKHYLLPLLLNSNNDKKIDRNFKNSKSITSITTLLDKDELLLYKETAPEDQQQHHTETDSLVTSSPSDEQHDLKLLMLTSARLNHDHGYDDDGDEHEDEDETKDNRRTCTKNFPVDNRISNKKNLVIKFNESQSATTATATVRRKTSPPSTSSSRSSSSSWLTLEKEDSADADIAAAAESAANGASDHHRDCDDYSDMTATTTTTRILGTTLIATSSSTAKTSTTMVGSTSRRLNCCPTAALSSSSSSVTSTSTLGSKFPTKTTTTTTSSTSTFSSAALAATAVIVTALPDVLRKFHISMRKDKKTMTAVTALYLILYIFTSAKCMAARQDASNCTFPQRWEGSWFLSGYQQSIHIKGSQFSYRGKCAASDGNKYLIVDEKGCHRCLVIYEKHKNVLQYKESECEGDSMYMHQSNPSAMAMRSILKSDHRGGAHPNLNGHSRLSSSDQYIMRSNDDMNDYFCKGRETLQNLCDQIPGDALLYSLFRENAEPVKCPLKGPFVFTYNRGHGECKSPVSNIESCTEDSRLLLSFQACPDVQGTESTVEELTCLATWKDGNSRYLVGLVSHHHAISNEERYRCFVYEKISSLMGGPGMLSSKDAEYKLAQSGDATCNGLDSAEVGSRIMSLRKPPPAERCDFPVWFKGPRHWHALMGNSVYNYHPNDGSMHIIKPNGYMETRALCEQINKQTATEMMAVVHYTTGCQSGFMCMIFYRRDTHVIEIQTGKQASRLEDACAPDHFDINKMPYITLLASNPDPQICPLEGLYHLRGAIGPPYISSRHKRNHNNNKGHTQHGHHHHDVVHKRHTTLSLHNTQELGHTSWHSNTRTGLPIRNRRDANLPALPSAAVAEVSAEAPPLSAAAAAKSAPLALAIPTTSSSSSSSSASSSLLLKSGSPLSVGDAIETNDLNQNQKTHDDDDDVDDDTTSSLLLKLPPRQLNHDNVQSRRITIATDGGSSSSRTNELEEQPHRQQKLKQSQQQQHQRHQDPIVKGIISSNSSSSSNSGNTSRESFMQRNTTTTSSKLLAQRSRRDAPGCIVNYKAQRQLWIGCTGPNLIDVRPQCNEDGDEEYSCHGSWSENGTVYVIARHKGTKHGVCISYRPLEGTAAKLVIGDACYRGVLKPPEHHLVANLTVLGKCGDTSSAQYIVHAPSTSILALFLSLASVFLPIQIMFTNR
ncbi:uncharacterized protein LOC129913071 isoform X2 [Episyrphus balteatus]|uniref:uncharacterized protein LOC129913071 isoform X2 n=1 Tax=Episyrphus balteatus TaxID=286459 RepID=UPI0024858674|nr:uncharacterized protein LOC129913071 isoform X2 [Episyrphus balteatus]